MDVSSVSLCKMSEIMAQEPWTGFWNYVKYWIAKVGEPNLLVALNQLTVIDSFVDVLHSLVQTLSSIW